MAAQTRLKVAQGLKVTLWAGEPLVKNITSFCFDSLGRAYVVETGRRRTSVFDIRNFKEWVEDDLAIRSVEEREQFLSGMLSTNRAFLAAAAPSRPGAFTDFNHDGVIDGRDLEVESERIQLVWDSSKSGHADKSMTFADGFQTRVSGVAAGVLAQGTNVWFTCIPDLWRLPAADPKSPAAAATRDRLLHGFGVHVAFGGHDLHGLIKGPDGRIYFSIADRGASVTNREGRVIQLPDSGAIFRCEPDGANFELFAKGLRNPQELCFDDEGNLWTGDNNGDGGDKARWTLVLEGADYGWTIGWQWLPKMGAWNAERLWHTRESNTAAYLVPPVAHIGHGPAGIAYYPGTGLPSRYDRHFFLTDFPGGVRTFAVEPDGAFFRVIQDPAAGGSWGWLEDNSPANRTGKLLWDLSPVDVAFPPGGGVVVADWVEGWEKTGKGRLWKVSDPALEKDPMIAETARILGEGMKGRSESSLLELLGHRDQRVRLEAQWELADRPAKSDGHAAQFAHDVLHLSNLDDRLYAFLKDSRNPMARRHAVWTLGQRIRTRQADFMRMIGLLNDSDIVVRELVIRTLGDTGTLNAIPALLGMVDDTKAPLATRVAASLGLSQIANRGGKARLFGDGSPFVIALGGRFAARGYSGALQSMVDLTPTLRLLRSLDRRDPIGFWSVANVLATLGSAEALDGAMKDSSESVRLATAVALRNRADVRIRSLLNDASPAVALEAARAIHDVPIPAAMPDLAGWSTERASQLAAHWPTNLNFTAAEWTTWMLRRVVDAQLRVGTPELAARLGAFAARTNAPEVARIEAVEALGNWAHPPRRDRIVGLIRPLPSRDPAPARAALESQWNALVADASPGVVVAALQAGAALKLEGLPQRLEALRTHSQPAVRSESARLLQASRPVVVSELLSTLEHGTVGEQQAALASLGVARDPKAAEILKTWADRLVRGQVPGPLQADVLEAARAAQLSLVSWTNSLTKDDALAASRPALSGGNAARGLRLFQERQDLGCARCHKLRGEGGTVGPELTGLGRARGREYVLQSILQPNAQIAPGYESVVLTQKGGAEVSGVLKSETASELVVQTAEDGVVTVPKSGIVSRQRGPSPMPEGLGEMLTLLELRDLIEVLSE
jgi:quinoprotein glucose dehydrogenase